MTQPKKAVSFNLQLFAEEASATAGDNNSAPPAAGTGDNNSAPPVADTGENSSSAVPPVTDNAAADSADTEISSEDNRLSFEELIKDERTAKEAKAFVNKRFKERYGESVKSLEAENAKMRQILDFQNLRYGLDPNSETYLDDFNEKVQSDAKLFEDEALAAGMDRDTFLKVKQADMIIEQNKRDSAYREQEELINNHLQNLMQQGEELKKDFENFDLEAEMQNPHFRSLVDPRALGGVGLSVKDAFFALHHEEIQKSIASNAFNKASVAVANTVAANKARPQTNNSSHKAAAVTMKSFKDMSLEDFRKARENYERNGISPF